MSTHSADERARRLLGLLAPIHDAARASSRRLCRSSDEGDDLFHDAALRALDRIDELRDETRFRAWFYAVLLSTHRTRARRSFWRRLVSLDDDDEGGEAPLEPIGSDGAAWEEERFRSARMARALARLPAAEREAIVLFELDGYSLDEVAAMQEASLSAVKSRLTRGRARLRRHYERVLDRAPLIVATAHPVPVAGAHTEGEKA